MRFAAFALISVVAFPVAGAAQSLNMFDQVSFDAGIGASYGPGYMGADENKTDPWFILRNVTLGQGGDEKQGFSLIPSLNYIGKRDAGDFDDLDGMKDISRAYEVGLKLSYVSGPFTSYTHVRQGFGGHHGIVGEIGTRYRQDVNERFTFWAGAELKGGDSKFTDTYFGVSEQESARSGIEAFDAEGGLTSAGVEVTARYLFNDRWGVEGEASWERLLNDAADSPITRNGDDDQYSLSVGLTRRISLDF